MAKKILVIEDYPMTVEMMVKILEMKGFEVDIAYEGKTGLEKAASGKPDLILLDIMMPGMNGIEVCRKLKADPSTARIPVVIVSVRTMAEDIKAAREAGADDYVTKPFDPDKLVEVVKKHLP